MPLPLLLCLVASVLGDVSNIVVPPSACLTITASSGVNVRDGACGSSILGSASPGASYIFQGGRQWCVLDATNYHFHEVDFDGRSGWIAGTLLSVTVSRSCGTAVFPAPEFRGMWVATVYNIDWPTSSAASTDTQQQEMREYVAVMDEMNLNVMVLQARPVGDAFYDTPLEPWSRYLTGTQGTAPDPPYDPLRYAVEQAHAAGIQVHAWLNPYRANMSPSCTSGLDANHMALRWPQHAKVYGNYCWMDPGAQVIEDHLLAVVEDIITRYDVDGIHFDDYFYPYPTSDPFPDDDTYAAYIAGGGSLARDDWRRENVNSMIQRVHSLIQATAPHVAFTISPFGIYRPGHSSGMPAPIAGLDPYTALYADAKLWLQEGWLDILAPQLYWKIHPPPQSYPTLLDWWVEANTAQRHVYAGIGLYRLAAEDGDWPIEEFEAQIDVSRCYYPAGSHGHIHFSAKFLRDNTKGIRERLQLYTYPNKVSPPPMSWKGLTVPGKPTVTEATRGLVWEAGAAEEGVVRWWGVYQRDGNDWLLLRVLPRQQTSFNVAGPGVYGVTAINSAHQHSEPAVVFLLDPFAQG